MFFYKDFQRHLNVKSLFQQLQKLWMEYADLADEAYEEYENIHNIDANNEGPTPTTNQTTAASAITKRKVDATYDAVIAMTRDIVQITQQTVPRYSKITIFVAIRIIYSLIVICVYVAFDLAFFGIINDHDSTDYYCPLPNGEMIRCMVPMMQFLWHGALIALCCSIFVLIITLHNTFIMLSAICSTSTSSCFLERVPLSGIAADLSWKNAKDQRTYKVLSKFVLHNICVLHPLNFLEAFVQHLIENKQVPQVKQVLGVGATSTRVPMVTTKYKGKIDPAEREDLVRETEGL